MELVFRLAQVEDAAALGEFMTRNFLATYSDTASPANLRAAVAHSYAEGAQRRQLSDDRNLGLLVMVGDEIAGHALLTMSGETPGPVLQRPSVEIARFYVDTRFHGRGIAQSLMDEVKREAAERGAASLWLSTAQTATQAIRFYGKVGFRIAGELIYMLGDDPKDDWLMVCDLAG